MATLVLTNVLHLLILLKENRKDHSSASNDTSKLSENGMRKVDGQIISFRFICKTPLYSVSVQSEKQYINSGYRYILSIKQPIRMEHMNAGLVVKTNE